MSLPKELRDRRARKCGLAVKGRTFTRWPVLVSVSTIDWRRAVVVDVLAPTASDAAHLMQDEFARKLDRPFEVYVVGVRGGLASYLFAGWERLTGLKMLASRSEGGVL